MQSKYTKNLQHRHRCVGRLILLTLVFSLNKQFTSDCPRSGGSSLANFALRPKCRKKAKAEGGLTPSLKEELPDWIYISVRREERITEASVSVRKGQKAGKSILASPCPRMGSAGSFKA